MTHIVVIGRYGQLARELQQTGLPPGWRMTSTDTGMLNLMHPASFAKVVKSLDADLIINAAAYTAVDQAEGDRETALQVNTRAPGQLADIAADIGVPFMHVSTDYVFSGQGGPWREDDRTEPVNFYGRSKLDGENAVLTAAPESIVIRTGWLFSRHGANFVKTMARLGTQAEEIPVVADQIGGPTAAADLAKAMIRIGRRLIEAPADARRGVFHFSGKPATTWAGLAKSVFEHMPGNELMCHVREISSAEFDAVATRPKNAELDCTLIRKSYGIERPDWRPALQATLQQLVHHQTPARLQ